MNANFGLLVLIDDPLRKQAVLRLTLNSRPPTRSAWARPDVWSARRKAQLVPLTEAPSRPLDCDLVPTA